MDGLQINLIDRFNIVDETLSDKVCKAHDLATNQTVCIKFWDKDEESGVNEVKVLSTLSHSSIPGFLCSFEEGDNRYLVSEWIDGITLEEYISSKGCFTEKECIEFGIKLCDVLSYMHTHTEGPFAYVDLKPANILVDDKGTKLWLVDFEAACHMSINTADVNKLVTKVLGTEIYSAPEVLYGKPCLQSDIYSVGAVLLYTLTGNPPVNRKRINDFGILGKLIEGCMKYEADERISTLEKVLSKLKELKEEPKPAVTDNVKIIKRNNKRIVVTVDGNMSFACELAFVATYIFNYRTAIFELTESDDIISYYLTGERINASMVSENDVFSLNYGMKTYLSRSSREWVRRGLLRGVKGIDNLFVARNEVFDELDISDVKDVRSFKSWACNNFDIAIIAAEERLYSSRKSAFMLNSDYVVAAPFANVDDIQLACAYYNRLSRQGYISNESVRFVAWDYMDKVSLPESGISMLVGENKYLGAIPFDQRRLISRNVKGSCYAGDALNDLAANYSGVIDRLMSSEGGVS